MHHDHPLPGFTAFLPTIVSTFHTGTEINAVRCDAHAMTIKWLHIDIKVRSGVHSSNILFLKAPIAAGHDVLDSPSVPSLFLSIVPLYNSPGSVRRTIGFDLRLPTCSGVSEFLTVSICKGHPSCLLDHRHWPLDPVFAVVGSTILVANKIEDLENEMMRLEDIVVMTTRVGFYQLQSSYRMMSVDGTASHWLWSQ